MSGFVVGKRYALALLSLAKDEKKVEDIGKDLNSLVEVIENSSELQLVILDPNIGKDAKSAILGDLAKKLSVDPIVSKFGRLLVDKGRVGIISDILQVYEDMANELLGKANAVVTVASKISSAQEKKIQEQLSAYTGKNITLTVQEDSSLIGGAVTKIDSLLLDGSVKNRINLIRETIIRG
ncbi:MAG: F-type H+-transporting ATPase subunit delta [bacterium]|jgi:F-type H+-transporting ATPase subunit delta